MGLYAFHDLALEVRPEGQEAGESIARLLHDLSWVETPEPARATRLSLSIRLDGRGLRAPPTAREVFRAEGFRGLEAGDDFYLTDGASLLYLQASKGQGEALLDPGFFAKPPVHQRSFWAFGLLKLLRPLGLYVLHAAGVVAPQGPGLLLVGKSGSGKSTLTLGLIRQGWAYLSDDAVLLRRRPQGVEALAFRKQLYVEADAAAGYADLPLGHEVRETHGGRKRRIRIEETARGQSVPGCLPRALLFPRVAAHSPSALQPLDRFTALRSLLAQSGPQLFDRRTMAQHLECLKTLLRYTTAYELRAGLDLYHHPEELLHLLRAAEGGERWPASSSS